MDDLISELNDFPEIRNDPERRPVLLLEPVPAALLHPDGQEVRRRHRGQAVCQVGEHLFP